MKTILFVFLLLLIPLASPAEELVLKGTFQGENLYVKNPFASSGVGFCIYEVTVNGLTTTDEINSSAFEIDLSVYGFNKGDGLTVTIKYKEDCQPKVLNPEVLNSRTTFVISSIELSDTQITWQTTLESGALPYVIEQFRWNKWVKVGQVNGTGKQSISNYSAPVRLHSGENKFRLKQIDYLKKPRYSKEISTVSKKAPVTFSPTRPNDKITFTAPTLYEIYDAYGGIVFKGYGREVKVAGLTNGRYYINYDNKMGRFTKK
ncbi:hypothetical protein DMA11_02085 [Marinilabiliaceae bacterium JC017]|nr:hypothetical protein DMA11_02085 [Marinilabiliaceae bacterium JC017]